VKGADLRDKSPQTIRLLAAEIARPFVTIDRHGAIFTNTGSAGIGALLLAIPFTIRERVPVTSKSPFHEYYLEERDIERERETEKFGKEKRIKSNPKI